MPFYASSLNMKNVYKLEIGEDPRTYSDFLFEISEQEYNALLLYKGSSQNGKLDVQQLAEVIEGL